LSRKRLQKSTQKKRKRNKRKNTSSEAIKIGRPFKGQADLKVGKEDNVKIKRSIFREIKKLFAKSALHREKIKKRSVY